MVLLKSSLHILIMPRPILVRRDGWYLWNIFSSVSRACFLISITRTMRRRWFGKNWRILWRRAVRFSTTRSTMQLTRGRYASKSVQMATLSSCSVLVLRLIQWKEPRIWRMYWITMTSVKSTTLLRSAVGWPNIKWQVTPIRHTRTYTSRLKSRRRTLLRQRNHSIRRSTRRCSTNCQACFQRQMYVSIERKITTSTRKAIRIISYPAGGKED